MAKKETRHGPSGDWMPASVTMLHVCTERELLTRFKKSDASFKCGMVAWLTESYVGLSWDVLNDSEMTLMLDEVEYSSSGLVNLLSLGSLLKQDWMFTTSKPNELPCKMFLTRVGKRL
ncbi:hypothetical protein PC129_g12783 [Phytophthora cactorum]|nr:hypothetical protein Pcac1_g3910 [Phytophthora cactorum]KAG2815815.1 hypothetical protein PC111_g13411 [Phytophthora cactorum]KAG2894772.1 hypothetical protein PC114_g15769 [Phytophthora cactorum]KAG2907526.1 hypothetical protein PC115_g13897 [Phytophthora cactorum]KAG2925278.1 hypothetical protein PC117_g15204 [Phytophthora cactorum]